MGILSSIMEKLGMKTHAPSSSASTPSASPADASASPSAPPTSSPKGQGAAGSAMSEVDIAQKLEGMSNAHGEKLNWRTSIVDLLKLVGLDSSLEARKKLATELHYSGSTDDSAAMNIWLHKEVMKKLAENGGKVPADLLD